MARKSRVYSRGNSRDAIISLQFVNANAKSCVVSAAKMQKALIKR